SRLYNTPLAIMPTKLDVIAKAISSKLLLGTKSDIGVVTPIAVATSIEKEVAVATSIEKEVAIVEVNGTLVSRTTGGESGMISYQQLATTTEKLVSEGYKTIGFNLDSPGGEIAGLYNFTNYLHSLRETGIRTFAYTDGLATSAAYAIAAATSNIYAVQGAIVGSIAVAITIYEVTKAMDIEGIKYKILTSKAGKIPISPYEEFTPEGIGTLMGDLMAQDSILNEVISKYRPQLTVDSILKLNGAVKVVSHTPMDLIDTVVLTLADAVRAERNIMSDNIQLATGGTPVSNQKVEYVPVNKLLKTEGTYSEGIVAERARILDIFKASKILGISDNFMLKQVQKGTPTAMAVELFTELAEQRAEATTIEAIPVLTATSLPKKKHLVNFGGEVVDMDEVKTLLTKRGKV
ncbi:MAG: S49 family peptidase, partial [Burkholderiales bacterium]